MHTSPRHVGVASVAAKALYLYSLVCASALGAVVLAQPQETPTQKNQPSVLEVLTLNDAIGPNVFVQGNVIYQTWLQRAASSDLDVAADTTPKWSVMVRQIDMSGQPSKSATITTSSAIFANWADFPSMTIAPDGTMVAHVAETSDPNEPYAYDVVLYQSKDQGRSWTRLGTAHDDGTATEHGFVSMVPPQVQNDGVTMFWLDGRNMASDGAHGAQGGGHGGGTGAMTLRTATMQPDGSIATPVVIDDRVCDCCPTSAAMTSSGPIVAYRNRSRDEVRDISIVRFVDGKWTSPELVHHDNWEIFGCPVNGPAIDAVENRVVIVWWTAANSEPVTSAVFSSDGGATFGKRIQIAKQGDHKRPLGRVDVVLLEESGDAVVSWLSAEPTDQYAAESSSYDTGGAVLRARRIRADGHMGDPYIVAIMTPGRASGFPRMNRVGDHLFFTWTDEIETARNIYHTMVPVESIP